MKTSSKLFATAFLAAALSGAALAQSAVDPAIKAAIDARHSNMHLFAFNLGLLGGMAQGKIDYDAEAATKAAANLVALSHLDTSRYWPEGSDTAIEGSHALPAIWTDKADFDAKWAALGTATEAMAAAAGTGVDGLKAALGGVGGACADCHKTYRARLN
ncbi:MAG: cytochrome c [Limimaricola sp.]|uniref:c-type cytochrome n=1 Tax=Limimaricola sp. TaxID=2211665 RepID=UPI001D57CBD7|nr:cytochrome c [Limimaricola sp.]MBI1418125.1 cytochrome c [Limimaricola sp.]